MTVGIYAIKNETNGKVYVGSSGDVERRWAWHRHALRENKHHNLKLQRSWNKHGEDKFSFQLIEECAIEQLMEREQHYIDDLKVLKNGYNIQPFARSSRGIRRSEQTKQLLSERAKRVGACPLERARRSERAKAQHAAGKLGAKTWTDGPTYNPKSAIAGAKALRAHIATQSGEEMARRARMRKSK